MYAIAERLVIRPATTFIVTISGDSLQRVSIYGGDLAVVDRSIKPRSGRVVVGALDGELVVEIEIAGFLRVFGIELRLLFIHW